MSVFECFVYMLTTCQNNARDINIDAKESGDSQHDSQEVWFMFRSSRPKPQTQDRKHSWEQRKYSNQEIMVNV